MYPAELEIKGTTQSTTSAFYLDLLLLIWRDGQLHISIYDRRDNYNFQITNVPFWVVIFHPRRPMAFLSLNFYDSLGLAPRMNVLFWELGDFFSELLKQGYFVEHLKSSFRKFHDRYGDLIQQYEVSLLPLLNDILSLTNCDFPTNQTFHQFHDLDTELYLHRIMSGFDGAFSNGVTCQQETLTLPDTWFRPLFWDLLMLQCVETRFLELATSSLHFSSWIPLCTFSILLRWWSGFYSICKRVNCPNLKWENVLLILKKWILR